MSKLVDETKMEISYIEVIKGVWKWYQSSILEPNDYCLMMRLIAISNDDMGWEDCFLRNNYELIGTTKLSYKQLTHSRNKLQQLGLIYFEQRNGLPNCKYQINFSALLDLSKKSKAEAKVRQRLGKGDGIDKLDKTRLDNSKSHCDAEAPPSEKKESTEHWDVLVKVWFDFYGEKFVSDDKVPKKPIFNAAQGKKFKHIIGHLKKSAKDANHEWVEDRAVRYLKYFLNKAWGHDDWIRQNFELGNLLAKFNSITNTKIEHGTGVQKSWGNNGKKPHDTSRTQPGTRVPL